MHARTENVTGCGGSKTFWNPTRVPGFSTRPCGTRTDDLRPSSTRASGPSSPLTLSISGLGGCMTWSSPCLRMYIVSRREPAENRESPVSHTSTEITSRKAAHPPSERSERNAQFESSGLYSSMRTVGRMWRGTFASMSALSKPLRSEK